jgi:hypothetical protein
VSLAASQVESYRRQGFLLRRGLLPAEAVARVHDDAREVFALQMRRLGLLPDDAADPAAFEAAMVALFERHLDCFVNCGKQAQHLVSLHALSLDARILGVLHELGLTKPNISTRPLLYFNDRRLAKKEVYWRLSAHQDWRSMQGSLDSVVVWMPLIDIDVARGALEVIAGSHRWGLLPAEMRDGYGHPLETVGEESFEPVEVRRGDALFFSAFLVHRSGTNVSDRIRWSCHFRYNNLLEPTFVERGFPHPYVYHPQEELITPGFPARQLLADLFAT